MKLVKSPRVSIYHDSYCRQPPGAGASCCGSQEPERTILIWHVQRWVSETVRRLGFAPMVRMQFISDSPPVDERVSGAGCGGYAEGHPEPGHRLPELGVWACRQPWKRVCALLLFEGATSH